MTPGLRGGPGAPRRRTRLALTALGVGLAVAAVGCTSGSNDAATSSAPAGPLSVLVGGGLGEEPLEGLADGTLTGTTAVLPGAVVSDDLNTRLQQSAPRVAAKGLRFAPESYDAVVLAALAAVAAQTDDGAQVAEEMTAVSSGGTRCSSFAECLPLAQKGADLDYDGVSGPRPLGADGSPTEASVAVATFDGTNQLPGINAPADTANPVTYRTGQLPKDASGSASPSGATSTTSAPGAGDGVLTVATVLPTSGSLGDLGRAELAGVRLAVSDIDAAGGVFGRAVALDVTDGGDPATTDDAALAADAVSGGADVVVGGGAQDLGVPLVAPVTDAGAVLVSPADASAAYGAAGDHGLAFRTVAPPEVLGVVAGRIASGDGGTVGLLSPRGSDGRSTAQAVTGSVAAAGGSIAARATFGTSDGSQKRAVAKVGAAQPDAVAVVVTDDPTALLTALADAGLL